MATVTLENVPDTFIKKYGKAVNFASFEITPRKKTLKERMEDSKNTQYGPFDSVQQMFAHMEANHED